jgi:LemA protein
MKKIIPIILVVLLFVWGVSTNNGLVSKQESVEAQWSKVETQYQRRADLIPNLVNTVKGEANFEQETLTAVIEARSKATSVSIDPSNLNANNIQQFQQAQTQLSGALSRLLVTVEKYPNLRANEAFRGLQVQLEGTENRIATERGRFNDIARTYNTSVRKFPASMIAGMLGFERYPYFEADKGAENAPTVDFGN